MFFIAQAKEEDRLASTSDGSKDLAFAARSMPSLGMPNLGADSTKSGSRRSYLSSSISIFSLLSSSK